MVNPWGYPSVFFTSLIFKLVWWSARLSPELNKSPRGHLLYWNQLTFILGMTTVHFYFFHFFFFQKFPFNSIITSKNKVNKDISQLLFNTVWQENEHSRLDHSFWFLRLKFWMNKYCFKTGKRSTIKIYYGPLIFSWQICRSMARAG